MMTCRRSTYFTDSEMIEYYQKTCGWSSKSTKTKNSQQKMMPDTICWKIISYGTYDCYKNIKIKLWSTINILKPWHCRNS